MARHNGTCIDITARDVNKAQGLHDPLTHHVWPEASLLGIGDGGDDIPMIRRYKGFTVHGAEAAVKAEASAVYDDVGAMLAAHMMRERFPWANCLLEVTATQVTQTI